MAAVLEAQAAGTASQQDDEPQNGLKLEQLLLDTPKCLLKPFKFFVSWQGVLTLAFRCASTIPLALGSVVSANHRPQMMSLHARFSLRCCALSFVDRMHHWL